MEDTLSHINIRYSQLANESCCLSCGGAIKFANAVNNEICVDLGSGRGTDVIRLAENVGSQGFVYGIDIAKGMIAKANELAKNLGVTNVTFIQSTLEKIPIETSSVDLVISNCTLNHAVDKISVWKEIFRILKPGGRFIISDIYAMEPVPDQFKNDPKAVAECWAGAVTREEYLFHIEAAGFNNIEILEQSAPYPKGSIMVISWTIKGFKN